MSTSHSFSGSSATSRHVVTVPSSQNDRFVDLYEVSDLPRLEDIAEIASDYFSLDKTGHQFEMLQKAAHLGERPHPNPYHNNSHFRLASLLELDVLKAHNHIYQGTEFELSKKDLFESLIAIFTHDLGHDGKTNVIDGVYVPYRLESKSSNIVRQEIDLPEDAGQRIHQMILGTDATFECPDTIPCNRILQAYDHVINDNQLAPLKLKNTPFEGLDQEPLTLMKCALIHVADIAATIALPPELLMAQAQALAEERGEPGIATAEGNLRFIQGLGQNILIPAAGRKAFGSALNRNVEYLENFAALQENEPYATSSG